MDSSLTKNASKTASGTILSRILGYTRDMLMASMFGAGMFADAFFVAIRIPNLFRRLFGEGAFSAAFIPVFSEYLTTKTKEETQKMLNSVFGALSVVLLAITLLGIVFSPVLVRLIAWGFADDPEKMRTTIELTRIIFPFLFFICIAAMFSATLNTLRSFFVPAAAPASISGSEIIYILALAPLLAPYNAIKGLALSFVFGALVMALVQYPLIKKLGYSLKLCFNFKHPAIKRIFFLMIPAMIGLSADQISAFVDNIFASFMQEGSITALYFSNRLMQMPLAVFGLALATVSLPAMSKARAAGDIDSVKKTLSFSIRFSIFILVPCALGLMTIGLPIVRLLFERGNFTEFASILTNNALFFYSLGLPAYAASRIFANTFYAFCDIKTPVKVAFASVFLHIVLCFILVRHLDIGGLALSTALSAYFNAAVLALLLRKKIGRIDLTQIVYSSAKSLLAAGAMAWVAFRVSAIFSDNLFIAVPAAIISGVIVFAALSYLLKSQELTSLISSFRKKANA
ncbi:MAG: murein biosynthesis integral membrane protein MurJ [Elusimicrobia bacterium]|nr:murein biosynthesis integral membrane protein MurJ [Elusimicrobiota bacterium]